MKDLSSLLHEGNHSLVVYNGNVSTFDGRGVYDLLRLLDENPGLLRGSAVADKVVGKAAAALMALAGVKEAYADVISQPAHDLLKSNGILTTYGSIVPHIANRAGTGLCPLETRCLPCATLQECLVQIRAFMEEIKTIDRKNGK